MYINRYIDIITYMYIYIYIYIYICFFSGNMERQKITAKRKRNVSKKENYMAFLRNTMLLIFLEHCSLQNII